MEKQKNAKLLTAKQMTHFFKKTFRIEPTTQLHYITICVCRKYDSNEFWLLKNGKEKTAKPTRDTRSLSLQYPENHKQIPTVTIKV